MNQKYSITGMSCEGCRSHVENAFKDIKGVHSVKVNLIEKVADIEADDLIGINKLRQALKSTPYKVNPLASINEEQ